MYTYNSNTVSDLHKDAFGFRPSQNWWAAWNSMDDDVKQREWDRLLQCLEVENTRIAAHEKEMIAKFEASILGTIESGAKDRETAIRWLVDDVDCRGDLGYFAYLNGLPYNYFTKT